MPASTSIDCGRTRRRRPSIVRFARHPATDASGGFDAELVCPATQESRVGHDDQVLPVGRGLELDDVVTAEWAAIVMAEGERPRIVTDAVDEQRRIDRRRR